MQEGESTVVAIRRYETHNPHLNPLKRSEARLRHCRLRASLASKTLSSGYGKRGFKPAS